MFNFRKLLIFDLICTMVTTSIWKLEVVFYYKFMLHLMIMKASYGLFTLISSQSTVRCLFWLSCVYSNMQIDISQEIDKRS